MNYCSGWKFDIGEKVWWVTKEGVIEVAVINRTVESNFSDTYNQYLLKSLVNNYCFWERESSINKIIKEESI